LRPASHTYHSAKHAPLQAQSEPTCSVAVRVLSCDSSATSKFSTEGFRTFGTKRPTALMLLRTTSFLPRAIEFPPKTRRAPRNYRSPSNLRLAQSPRHRYEIFYRNWTALICHCDMPKSRPDRRVLANIIESLPRVMSRKEHYDGAGLPNALSQ
jgi:hypothetical protein